MRQRENYTLLGTSRGPDGNVDHGLVILSFEDACNEIAVYTNSTVEDARQLLSSRLLEDWQVLEPQPLPKPKRF